MGKPVIVFDVDSTLLDFIAGFQTWMALEGHSTPHGREVITHHDRFLPDLYPQFAHLDARETVLRFYDHTSFAEMPLLNGIETAMHAIRKANPGCKLYALSSMGRHELGEASRRRNLASLPLDDFTALNFGELKVDKLRELNAHLFFDDHPGQIEAAEVLNIPAVLVNQPWNVKHQVKHRLTHWDEGPALAARLLTAA